MTTNEESSPKKILIKKTLIKKIRSIEVVPSGTFYLGDEVNGRKIAIIEDKSVELETKFIDNIYLCKDENNNVLAQIEKCATIVRYEYEVENEYEEDEEEIERLREKILKMKEEVKSLAVTDEMHQEFDEGSIK